MKTDLHLDAIEAACNNGLSEGRSPGIGAFTILNLVAALRVRDTTIIQVRELAERYASTGWRDIPSQSVDQAEAMNACGDAVLAIIDAEATS